jgi:Kdo2-lipid IVA lauroyltransferase/acyltransferase
MKFFLRLLAKLPTVFWYKLSTYILFPLLFYVVKYRRKIVQKNLRNAFPEDSKLEIQAKEKAFFRYLADLFVETIRSFSIPEKELSPRIKFENVAILEKLYAEGKSVILTLGHIGNYEWMAQAFPFALPHQSAIAYKKIKNKTLEALFKESRGKYGVEMFPTEDTGMFLRKKHSRPFMLALANDQSAPPLKCFWTKFLNQPTSFFMGTEKIAVKMNLPVVFAHVTVPKRGHYTLRFELITDQAPLQAEGNIMNTHAAWLEQDIKISPAYWLWSHKRWKHRMPDHFKYGFTE